MDTGPHGGGLKQAAHSCKKMRVKAVPGAKGHSWNTAWLEEFCWLATEPRRTKVEWDERPTEGPDYIFCLCCSEFPGVGHKDVVQKKSREAMRRDKLRSHADAAHVRAMAAYEKKFGSLTMQLWDAASQQPPATPPTPQVELVDPPLAALVRTAVSTALSKSALRLVPGAIRLQRANGLPILDCSESNHGIQPFLHAAAVVLKRAQNDRLRAAGMFSKMGDGSSDKKTTEQEIIHVRYPTTTRPITESLGGIKWLTEFFDILDVDVTYSADKKSFDATAVLKSTYHAAFLERDLASLPEPEPEMGEEMGEETAAPLGADRARRAATDQLPPTAAVTTPEAISLHTHNLTVGPGEKQIYPSRLVTTSLDGASVNMGEHGGVAALLKKEVVLALALALALALTVALTLALALTIALALTLARALALTLTNSRCTRKRSARRRKRSARRARGKLEP